MQQDCRATAGNVRNAENRGARDGSRWHDGGCADEAGAGVMAHRAAGGVVEDGARRGVSRLPSRGRRGAFRGMRERHRPGAQRLEDQEQSGAAAPVTGVARPCDHVILTARGLEALARA